MNLTCNRCGHVWETRRALPPSACAKCKSKRYDEPRVYAIAGAPEPTELRPSSVRRRPEIEARKAA